MTVKVHATKDWVTGSGGVIPVASISASGTPSSTTYLRGDGTWASVSGGGGGSPGGSNTQIQFNDSGTFAGSSGLTFNKDTGVVQLTGTLSSSVPGDNIAIKLVGGDGGTTQGARIGWYNPDGVTGIWLDSNHARRINATADAGTFGLRSTVESEASGTLSSAVLDTDTSSDESFARAHVILSTQFNSVRLTNTGDLASTSDVRVSVDPGWAVNPTVEFSNERTKLFSKSNTPGTGPHSVLDIQGFYKDATETGSIGDGARLNFVSNDNTAFPFTAAVLNSAVTDPTNGAQSAKFVITVPKSTATTDDSNAPRLEFDSSGSLKVYDNDTLFHDITGGGGGSPVGPDQSIQFKNGTNFSGTSDFIWDVTGTALYIGAPTLTASSPLSVEHNYNSYSQIMNQNTSAGASASTDFVATANNGTDSTYYVDLGINSSGYSDPAYSMAGPNDAYLYSVGGDIAVGTQSSGTEIKFHTGGTTTDEWRMSVNDTGIALIAGTSSAAAPATGVLNIYSRIRAGKACLEARGNGMKGYSLQPAFYGNNVVMWMASAGTTVSIAMGDTWTARNTTGAQSAGSLATTNLLTSMKRMLFNSTTAGNTGAGIQSTTAQFWRGNAAGFGGFYFFARFGVETTGSLSGSAAMVGLSTLNGVLGTQTPSTLSGDYACLTKDANQTNWFFSTRNNSTTTKLDTGLAFATGSVYDFTMYCPPNGSNITVRLVEYPSDTVYLNNVEVTSTLPRNTVFMYAHAHCRHSGTASIEALALNRIYVESDF